MRPIRLARLLAVLVCLAQAGFVRAQYSNIQMPNMGSMGGLPSGGLAGAKQARTSALDPGIAVSQTFAGFIDSAVPRNRTGVRFEAAYNNRQPMRAEYLFAKGGLPNTVGFPLPETRVDYQELTSFTEYSWTPWFSVFIEAPYRWVNPEINDNHSGAGDMRYGLKLCTYSADRTIATVLLRLYSPSTRHQTLGTSHWSIEPGILMAYQFNRMLHFEGEFRYWMPLGGSDFQGNILRYGAAISYGQRRPGLWFTPVLEGIGWSVLSGKTMIATSAEHFEIQEARGQTIANGCLGLRCGYGAKLDMYAGYGRSFTGQFWQREIYRVELRYSY